MRYKLSVVFVALLLLSPFVNFAASYYQHVGISRTAGPASTVDAQTGSQWLVVSDGMDEQARQEEYSLRKNSTQTLTYVMWASGLLAVLLMMAYYRLRRYGLLNTSKEVGGDLKEVFAGLVESLSISRSLRLYQCEYGETIAMTGFYKPVVIIPVSANYCDQDFLKVILAWQLAKIKQKGNVLGYACNTGP